MNSKTAGNFNVFLKCRLKNDILDTRQAEIDVDIATGGVLAYKGNIVNMNDFSYVPKIEKSEVIDLINNKFYQIKNGEMKIEYMFLSLSPFRDSWKWKWLISLTGRNEDGYLNGYIDVDSETGQILESNLK